jgi:hypothetical protein
MERMLSAVGGGTMSRVDAPLPSEPGEEIETVDGVPVLAEVHELVPAPAVPPAVTTAAVAATGFLAGAATYALLQRRATRRMPGASLSASLRGAGDTSRRTYLVHVVSRRLD